MKSDREKSTGVMGLVVSLLLHAIFFAGCIALDYSDLASTDSAQPTEINKIENTAGTAKS